MTDYYYLGDATLRSGEHSVYLPCVRLTADEEEGWKGIATMHHLSPELMHILGGECVIYTAECMMRAIATADFIDGTWFIYLSEFGGAGV